MKRVAIITASVLFLSIIMVVFCAQDTQQQHAEEHREKHAEEHKQEKELTPVQIMHQEEKEEKSVEENMHDVYAFDQDAKRKSVIALVERGVQFAEKNTLEAVGRAFTHTQEFIEGELYLFLLDIHGVVYAHGDQSYLLWRNLWDYRDSFGALIVQAMIGSAQKKAGWVTYEWNGSMKLSYVQLIKKDDKEYVIGAGYYPHSKEYAVIGLVKGAVALFEQTMAEKKPIDEVFGTLSYPLSNRFVFGDLYLYALDFNGIIRAQGDRPGLIGTNALEYKDSKGTFVNKGLIEKLQDKQPGEGIWFEYVSKNAQKKAYAEKVTDAQGKHYFIACGYYPEIKRDDAINLVRRGYQLMKSSGKSIAVHQFTDKNENSFRLGDLYLFVYDMKGLCVASGESEDNVGQNYFEEKDQDGRYYIREFIEQAKTGGGWVDTKIYNSFESVYVEKIDLGIEEFVIGAGIFPISKSDTMSLLVKSAIGYLKSHTEEEALEKFVTRNGEFIRGDLYVYAIDHPGFCWAWGDSYALIWQNLLNWKDDKGKLFIKEILEKAKEGPDTLVYTLNKRKRVTYFEEVEKDGEMYIIGSGFYR